MAVRTLDFLPDIFRTDVNEKFVNATVEQLTSEPKLKRVNGFIGRRFSPLYQSDDNYISENTVNRSHYQLEPSIVIKDSDNKVQFLSHYSDLLDKIRYYGGLTNNQSRLFSNESYSYDGGFDFDKFINFSQYYWLPNGPDAVDIYSAEVQTEAAIDVTHTSTSSALNDGVGYYNFSSEGEQRNPTLILARGGSYEFNVSQDSNFWIQTYPGTSGAKPSSPNISSREVLGVVNNGDNHGIVTFNVPESTAQDFYINMPNVMDIDLAITDLTFAQIQNYEIDAFNAEHNGIDNQRDLDSKFVIFVENAIADEDWTAGGIYGTTYGGEYDEGDIVPETQRDGIFRIDIVDGVLQLTYIADVPTNHKVRVTEGGTYSSREFYKTPSAVFELVPVTSAVQNELFYQDGTDGNLVGVIKLVDPGELYNIDINDSILGKVAYTSPNGVIFTNGLKVRFNSKVEQSAYANEEYYIEGVGEAITLTKASTLVTPESFSTNLVEAYDILGYDTTGYEASINSPMENDYLLINRASLDGNSWSRGNRWFHIDVINATAEYNNFTPVIDQSARAQRPIIEFDANLQLFNFGKIAHEPINVIDTIETDAFSNYEGQTSDITVDGLLLQPGMKIIFANDAEEAVRANIYNIELIDPDGIGVEQYHFVIDSTAVDDDTVLIQFGTINHAKMFYMSSGKWINGQQRIDGNQAPLFDVFDKNGISLSDVSVYRNSTFVGTEVYSYQHGTSTNDPVLGFPLSYRNFNNVGDIVFENDFDADSMTYNIGNDIITLQVNAGFLHQTIDRDTFEHRNVWTTVEEDSKQYQLASYLYNGTVYYQIDNLPAGEGNISYYNVYHNNKLLARDDYSFQEINNVQYIVFNDGILGTDSKIDIMLYSEEISNISWYRVPSNLENNAQNRPFESSTLGQMRNHVNAVRENSTTFDGVYPGNSNLRDLPLIKSVGGNILQHSAGTQYASMFLLDDTTNFIDATKLAQREYIKFKNNFMDLAARLALNFDDIPGCVDAIIEEINDVKTSDFPYFASDMVPYGSDKTTINYSVTNAAAKDYELTEIFSTELSNKAVLVYVNGEQVLHKSDYTFETDRPYILFTDSFTLYDDDVITIVEYNNTDGNWIPETPSKLGLFPAYEPARFVDNSYLDPIEVIQGHDGSVTPVYGDVRDDLLLEIEKRIYNNIKVEYDRNRFDVFDVKPGKFRNNEYSLQEVNSILAKTFFQFVGENKVDYSTNTTFNDDDGFTYNYRKFVSKLDNEAMSGSWRAVYDYHYDTYRPNTHPWEMLGITVKPSWWEDRYGPAPYTAGNTVLWNDLSAGIIYAGENAGVDENFIRPDLLRFLPVDNFGNLRSPDKFLVAEIQARHAGLAFEIGEQGPTEAAWRRSSFFPYAMQIVMALAKPAKYFGLYLDTTTYVKNTDVNQYLTTDTNQRIQQEAIKVNSSSTRSASYINWIADLVVSLGMSSNIVKTKLEEYNIQLSYKVAGFTDKDYLKVFAEQSSPSSNSSSIIVPDEDYDVFLNKSAPVARVNYSAVIIQKTSIGYKVDGYNLGNPHFTILPSVVNNNLYAIDVLDERGIVYKEYYSAPVTIPYGHEFTSKKQVVDFLVSYSRYLEKQGFYFDHYDEEIAELRNWVMSSKEFLFWSQQGWSPGNVIVLSPIGSEITLNTPGAVVDQVGSKAYGNKVLDQNFKALADVDFTVKRINNDFKLNAVNGETISFAEFAIVQYEHTLIFNNETVFNDIIYKPELGNRQSRLKMVGFVTNDWDGNLNPGGFVYNEDNIVEWSSGTDYKKGDILKYKGTYYVASKDLSATNDFEYANWFNADDKSLKTGLIPNFANRAGQSELYYDIDGINLESDVDRFSKGLIGYRPRDYFDNLGIDDTSQVKFYQGMIREKGTNKALEALTRAKFDKFASDVNVYEEWAVRVGEYGATDSTQFVEVALDELEFDANPASLTFRNVGEEAINDVINYYETDLFNGPKVYDKDIFITRQERRGLDYTIKTAGYPQHEEVDFTLFDKAQIAELNQYINETGTADSIWVAKDLADRWDVYRVTETNLEAIEVINGVDGTIEINTNTAHNLEANQVVLIKNTTFDGWFTITEIKDSNTFIVEADEVTENDELAGTIFVLTSNRLDVETDLANNTPLNGWRDEEIVYVDNYDIDGNWAVLQKQSPWSFNNKFEGDTDYLYGYDSAATANGLTVVVGQPGNDSVSVMAKNHENNFEEVTRLTPVTATSGFGKAVEMINGTVLAIGAPDSDSASGNVHIFNRTVDDVFFGLEQVISLPATVKAGNEQFGHTIALSSDNNWMYVGRPGTTGLTNSAVRAYARLQTTFPTSTIIVGAGAGTYALGFTPSSELQLSVQDSNGDYYVPYVDFTVIADDIIFTTAIPVLDITVRQLPEYYEFIEEINAPTAEADDNFGYSISTTTDGAQFVVGAPMRNDGVENSGAAYLYDRSIEAFIGDGTTTVFNVQGGFDNTAAKIVVAGDELVSTEYEINMSGSLSTDTTGIVIIYNAPVDGALVEIHTNRINLVEQLEDIDISENNNFGYALDICKMNCAIFVGSPNFDPSFTTSNQGAAYRYSNQSRNFGSTTGTASPTVTVGHNLRINNHVVEFTGNTLAEVILDINNARIPSVTASNVENKLYIESNSVVNFNRLFIAPGTVGSALSDLGLTVFPQVETISHPLGGSNENFGRSIKISNQLVTAVIGSSNGSSWKHTEFDSLDTTFDQDATRFISKTLVSGAAYVFEYAGDINPNVENAGKFIFSQQLTHADADRDDQFGFSITMTDDNVLVGSPKDEVNGVEAGTLYEFRNINNNRSWEVLRVQEPVVDIEAINRIFIYNKNSNTIVSNLDYIDPVKGKILGVANQEIDYKTPYDPALYSNGEADQVVVNETNHWTHQNLGKVWWDLDTIRYVDYEQDDIEYRTGHWGNSFPGSSVDVYEWIESRELPSNYTGTGTPKHIDNSAYSEVQIQDPVTGAIASKYYYWVKDVEELNVKINSKRKMPTSQLAGYIENPKGQGIAYAALNNSSTISLYNVGSLLEDENVILHVDYDIIKSENTIHAEYALIQEGNDTSSIPTKIVNKMIDSLAGLDINRNAVPDFKLPASKKYGISIRPRQTMFVDRTVAMRELVIYVNKVFAQHQILENFDTKGLYSEEPIPNIVSGAYDQIVDTIETLSYLDINSFAVGYNILVENDYTEGHDGLWTIYSKTSFDEWQVVRTQAYDTSMFWDAINWVADSYDIATVADYVVADNIELQTLSPVIGNIIKILDNGNGQNHIVEVTGTGYETMLLENATLELKASLYDTSLDGTGFDSSGYDSVRYDQSSQLEIRNIIDALFNDIFVDELAIEFNNLYFVMMRYVLSEQPFVDWIFKTSFITVNHAFSKLEEFPNYQRNDQTYVESYINEVKPYRTKIREYLLNYERTDVWGADVTDFDLPAYYDINLNRFRSPSGEQTEDQEIINDNLEYHQWSNHHAYIVDSITVENPGSGYTVPPLVTITGGGGIGASAEAIVAEGEVKTIVITSTGAGYISTPTVTIESGVSGSGAKGYAHLLNEATRKIATTMKFDRITYGSTIGFGGGYDSTKYDEDFGDAALLENANDRIWSYYKPADGALGMDLAQLVDGIDYPGVVILGEPFNSSEGYDISSYDTTGFAADIEPDTIIQSSFLDTTLGTKPEDINVSGGGFVDTFNSHAPQELVPGRVYDTLDMQVFTVTSSDWEDDGANPKMNLFSYVASGSDTVYSYEMANEDDDVLFVYTKNDGAKQEGVDYTVDYNTFEIIFTVAPTAADSVLIYVTDHAGKGEIFDESFIGNGVQTDFPIPMPASVTSGTVLGYGALGFDADNYDQLVDASALITSSFVDSALVLVDGVSNTNFSIEPTSAHTSAIVFDTAPAAGVHVHVHAFTGDNSEEQISEVNTQHYLVVAPTPTYPVDYTIAMDKTLKIHGPLEANFIVELNNKRLAPANTQYYLSDGSTTEFSVPTSILDMDPNLIANNDISVFVEGVEQVELNDYIVIPSDGVTVRKINMLYVVPEGNEVAINLLTEAEFSLNSNNEILIDENVTINNGDKIKIITFATHDVRRMRTKVYRAAPASTVVPIYDLPIPELPGGGYDVLGYGNDGFDSGAGGIFDKLTDPNYFWVTLNGVRLFPGIDFELATNGQQIEIGSHITVLDTDFVVITTFSEYLQNPQIGFRIFHNMNGYVEYLRMSKQHTAKLATDLAITDTTIYVDDTEGLAVPSPIDAVPGVIFINGERITYYQMDTVNHTLTQLRRGTEGTGAPEYHSEGDLVADGGITQELPGTAGSRPELIDNVHAAWAIEVADLAELNALETASLPNNYKVLVRSTVEWELGDATPPRHEIYSWQGSWVTMSTEKVWYNNGSGKATDGNGLQSATTAQAMFLKAGPTYLLG